MLQNLSLLFLFLVPLTIVEIELIWENIKASINYWSAVWDSIDA